MKQLVALIILSLFLLSGCVHNKVITEQENLQNSSFKVALVITSIASELIPPEIYILPEGACTYKLEEYHMNYYHSGSIIIWEIRLRIQPVVNKSDKEREYLLTLDLHIPGVLKEKDSKVKKDITWDTSMSNKIVIQDNVYLLLNKTNL